MTDATDVPAGWILITAAAIWAGKGVSVLIGSRRQAATAKQGDRSQKWQWLTLAAMQVILGVWFITGPSRHAGISWWLLGAGFVALMIWMFVTDVGPWLRSRVRGRSSHESS